MGDLKVFCRILFIGFVLGILAGCYVPPSKVPDTPMPDPSVAFGNLNLDSLIVCNKNESELSLAKFSVDSTLVFEDRIENMDIESTYCDGKVTTSHGATRSFSKLVEVEPDTDYGEAVNFIKVENQRTCATHALDYVNEPIDKKEETVASSQPSTTENSITPFVKKNGRAKFRIDDIEVKLFSFLLNVKDGFNPVTIHYYGKCLKYKDGIGEGEKLNFAMNCLEAEELGRKEILIQLKIDRPEVPGLYQRNTCTKTN